MFFRIFAPSFVKPMHNISSSIKKETWQIKIAITQEIVVIDNNRIGPFNKIKASFRVYPGQVKMQQIDRNPRLKPALKEVITEGGSLENKKLELSNHLIFPNTLLITAIDPTNKPKIAKRTSLPCQ